MVCYGRNAKTLRFGVELETQGYAQVLNSADKFLGGMCEIPPSSLSLLKSFRQ